MRLNPRKRPSKPPIWGIDSICNDSHKQYDFSIQWRPNDHHCLCLRTLVDKAPRLSITLDIWILLSHTICQIQPNHLQIVRRQCCLDLGYKANPSHALCSLELEHTWLLIRMMSMININISNTNRWQQWSPGRRSEQRRCLCRMHCICCRLLSRKDLVWCLLFDVLFTSLMMR